MVVKVQYNAFRRGCAFPMSLDESSNKGLGHDLVFVRLEGEKPFWKGSIVRSQFEKARKWSVFSVLKMIKGSRQGRSRVLDKREQVWEVLIWKFILFLGQKTPREFLFQ